MARTNKDANNFVHACLSEDIFRISDEKAYEHAGEILQTIRDLQTDEIFGEVEALVRKHRSTASNEVIAVIAWEAYCDSCDGWDIPTDETAFFQRFPEFS